MVYIMFTKNCRDDHHDIHIILYIEITDQGTRIC
jgi:hypothetical protein